MDINSALMGKPRCSFFHSVLNGWSETTLSQAVPSAQWVIPVFMELWTATILIGHKALQDWGLLNDWMYKKCFMTVWKGNPLLEEISFAIVATTLKSRGCHRAMECCCLKIPSRITELLYWIKLVISPVSQC